MVADSDPYATKTVLPLSDVLTSLKKCPARKKLLVLDLMSPAPDPLELSGTSDGVADVIRTQVLSKDDAGQPDDPHLFVLTACSDGEVSLWSESLGQSVFGYYFVRAFSDPEAGSSADGGPLTVRALAGYLAKNVDRWARQHRGVRQRPMLISAARDDFSLGMIDTRRERLTPKEKTAGKDKPDEKEKTVEKEKAGQPAKGAEIAKKTSEPPATGTDKDSATNPESDDSAYPQWLTNYWKLHEKWLNSEASSAAPRVFRQLETTLLRAEREWRSGGEPVKLRDSLARRVGDFSAEMEHAIAIEPPTVRSVGQAPRLGRQADPALVKTLKELLEKRRKPEPATATPEESKKKPDEQKTAFIETLKKGKTALISAPPSSMQPPKSDSIAEQWNSSIRSLPRVRWGLKSSSSACSSTSRSGRSRKATGMTKRRKWPGIPSSWRRRSIIALHPCSGHASSSTSPTHSAITPWCFCCQRPRGMYLSSSSRERGSSLERKSSSSILVSRRSEPPRMCSIGAGHAGGLRSLP